MDVRRLALEVVCLVSRDLAVFIVVCMFGAMWFRFYELGTYVVCGLLKAKDTD